MDLFIVHVRRSVSDPVELLGSYIIPTDELARRGYAPEAEGEGYLLLEERTAFSFAAICSR